MIINLAFTTFSWCNVILSHIVEDDEKFSLTQQNVGFEIHLSDYSGLVS